MAASSSGLPAEWVHMSTAILSPEAADSSTAASSTSATSTGSNYYYINKLYKLKFEKRGTI
jgi:hypothetical protein